MSARARHAWARLPESELLDLRLCDLGLRIEGSVLEVRVARLHRELEARGLRFRPNVWLSTGWFSPRGVPGFAIPFFLAHPRLARLERRQMLEVEGGGPAWCMKLLRHETGHAIDSAYRLRRRARFREVFGRASAPYRASYVPRPGSRRFVLHLDNWYAQSHPLEDFAESFAVWLRPRHDWRARYRGWPALRKLEAVDAMMAEVARRPRLERSRWQMDALPTLRTTLGEYYAEKKRRYGTPDRRVYDRDLRRLFSDEPEHARRPLASSFLRERRVGLRRHVAEWTGQHPFVVDEVIGDMLARSRELRLRLRHGERRTGEGAAILLTLHAARILGMRGRPYFR